MTLNNACHRNIDKVISLKKEEFFKINEKVNKNILNEIYEEILSNKLDIVYECKNYI